jgi:hypothetical protein
MKSTILKSPAAVWLRAGALALSLLGLEPGPAAALEQEVRLAGTRAMDLGGNLESSIRGAWLGGETAYAVRLAGPLWLHAGFALASASGLSAASLSPLKLACQSIFAGAGAFVPFGRLELGLRASLSEDRLREDFFPAGRPDPIRTRVSGLGWAVSVRGSWALSRRFLVPVELQFHSFTFGGPVNDLSMTQFGLTAGVAWRLGRKP